MSDNIPFELQGEIIKWVDVKSLLKFRSVSKEWKSLIDSPEFAADYCVHQSPPHRLLIRFLWSQAALDGVIYWHAFEMIKVDNGTFRHHNLIMSFDLNSEGFEEVCLPDNLARLYKERLSIHKRMESLVVLEIIKTGTSYGVWMMEQGVTKSFTKLFNVTTWDSHFFKVHGFLKNGEPVVSHGYGSVTLFAYDPYSEKFKDLVIIGRCVSLSVNSYMETLLLIDQ
uniref:uncharacterized protein LOC122601916 n=1 Tax=Erigeron canadensis TaxID=72917 RepID=UPI001CB98272|nr:uncharacterized protein LOC122601916 [Erigeron canadensis]